MGPPVGRGERERRCVAKKDFWEIRGRPQVELVYMSAGSSGVRCRGE
jgi:hypothetical protein